jgi:hypothetical protein
LANQRIETIKKKIADRYGIETDVFCDNDIDIYCQQMEMLQGLKKQLQEDGYVVTKEYVKGRMNVCSHPCIGEYNKTADSSHKTVNAIRKFIEKNSSDALDDGGDELMKILNGDSDND